MLFNQFVFRNTLRNSKVYLAYFFSSLLCVMTFFTFMAFFKHPQIAAEKIFDSVKRGLFVTSLLMLFFSCFYVYYAMTIFLQSRKKEFGLLLMQGLSPKQLKRMIFQENCLIGGMATFLGSLLGIFFTQFILLVGRGLFGVSLPFYFPFAAFQITSVVFLPLFTFFAFFMRYKIPKLSLAELFLSQENGSGTVAINRWKSWLALFLLFAGYGIALVSKGTVVVFALLPVVSLVVLGTKWFFQEYSVMLVKRLTENHALFWKKTNLLVFSDLSFRMKDNARSFFIVTIISTVAFSAIGTLYGFKSLMLDSQNLAFDFSVFDQSQMVVTTDQIFQEKLTINNIAPEIQTITCIPVDKTVDYAGYITSYQQYNQLAKFASSPEIPEIAAATMIDPTLNQQVEKKQLEIFNQKTWAVQETATSQLFSGFYRLYLLPDDAFESLLTQKSASLYTYKVWNLSDVSESQQYELGKEMLQSPNFSSKVYGLAEMRKAYAPILYIGLFIGLVFFVASGSFLYFRLYSDLPLDIEKFKRVYKLGLTKRELRKMVRRQVGILFFTPIILSLLHGLVALTAMYQMLTMTLQSEALVVLGSFLCIQILYYAAAQHFYFLKVYQGITN